MKKSIKTLLIGTAIAGSLAAGLALAMPPGGGETCMHGGHGMGFGRHGMDSDASIERMAQRLDLTTEQRDKVRAIVDKARPQTRVLRDKLAENHKQLHALTQQGTAQEAEVRKLADSQGKLIADMIVQHNKERSEINAVLTPAQREKLRQQFEPHRHFSSTEPSGERGDLHPGT
jgi:Spy/CpxP family protein refolding chaperone